MKKGRTALSPTEFLSSLYEIMPSKKQRKSQVEQDAATETCLKERETEEKTEIKRNSTASLYELLVVPLLQLFHPSSSSHSSSLSFSSVSPHQSSSSQLIISEDSQELEQVESKTPVHSLPSTHQHPSSSFCSSSSSSFCFSSCSSSFNVEFHPESTL